MLTGFSLLAGGMFANRSVSYGREAAARRGGWGGVSVWAPGPPRCPFLPRRPLPAPPAPRPAATHRAARGQGRQFPSVGLPAPAARPGPAPLRCGAGRRGAAPPARAPPPPALAHMRSPGSSHGEGGRRDGGSAFPGHAVPPEELAGLPAPSPRWGAAGPGPGPARTPGPAGPGGFGSGRLWRGCQRRGRRLRSPRGRARWSARRPGREGKGREGSLAVTGEALAASSESSGFQRFLTFVDILRLPRLHGCHPHDASKAPVFPSTRSSAAKNHINLL